MSAPDLDYLSQALDDAHAAAKECSGVTGARDNSETFPHICNCGMTWGEYYALPIDANVCHHCRSLFGLADCRYPIRTGNDHFSDGIGLVSVCNQCFEGIDVDERTNWPRYQRQCKGCDAPLMTPVGTRFYFNWEVCSTRCYKRVLRKSKHTRKKCAACPKYFKPVRHDAQFCSNACRQWTYRRRRQGR